MVNNKEVWVCSNSALDYIEHPEDIRILRSTFTFGSDPTIYEDFIDMDSDAFYQYLNEHPDNIAKTAYISAGKVHANLEDAKQKGVKDILVILISGELSGLVNYFKHLSQTHEYQGVNVHVYDSRTLVFAQSYMALVAHRMFADNQEVDAVLEVLDKIRDNNHLLFAVDTLKYLVLNGRLSKSTAMIGNFLKMKPLLHLEGGKVKPLEKARTTKNAVNKVLEHYFNNTSDRHVLTYIVHADDIEAANELSNRILEVYPNRQIIIGPLSPVVGAHSGPKAIGIGSIDLNTLSTYKSEYFTL